MEGGWNMQVSAKNPGAANLMAHLCRAIKHPINQKSSL